MYWWMLKRWMKVNRGIIPNLIRIHVILWCHEKITFVRNAVDIFRRVHFIVKYVNNVLPSATIIVFGWIVASVNRITNSFYAVARSPCLHFYSVPIYRWHQFVTRSSCFGFLALVYSSQMIVAMFLANMSKSTRKLFMQTIDSLTRPINLIYWILSV